MNGRRNLNENEIDALFSGKTPSGEESWAEIARHLAGARSQLLHAPVPAVEQVHLAAMLEAAREQVGEGETVVAAPPRRSLGSRLRGVAIKVGAGAMATSLSTAGLAYAGVDLPGQAAEKAFEAVGIELPNQGSDGPDKSVSQDVQQVIEGMKERGCDFGEAVAAVASQNRQDETKTNDSRCSGTDADDEGTASGDAGKARAEERSGGRSKADEAARGGKSTGAAKGDEGRARAEEKSQANQQRNDAPSGGPSEGGPPEGAPHGSSDTGDAASSSGRERADEASSGGRDRAGQTQEPPPLPDVVERTTRGARPDVPKGPRDQKPNQKK